MKKIILLLVSFLYAYGTMAQDTIHYGDPRYLYMSNRPMLSGTFPTASASFPEGMEYKTGWQCHPDDCQQYYTLNEPITIYGISCFLVSHNLQETQDEDGSRRWFDTSSIDFLLLKHVYGSMSFDTLFNTAERSYPIVKKKLTLSSHLQQKVDEPNSSSDYCYEVPSSNIWACEIDEIHNTYSMYEYYFDSPITLSDTFRLRTWDVQDGQGYRYQSVLLFILHDHEPLDGDHMLVPTEYDDERFFVLPQAMLFPILTPYQADTNGGQDPTATVMATGSDARVDIAPNPASRQTRVRCGEAMQHLTLSDVNGRTMIDLHPNSREAHIDLGSLPQGCYIVGITTHRGTTHRKFVVSE